MPTCIRRCQVIHSFQISCILLIQHLPSNQSTPALWMISRTPSTTSVSTMDKMAQPMGTCRPTAIMLTIPWRPKPEASFSIICQTPHMLILALVPHKPLFVISPSSSPGLRHTTKLAFSRTILYSQHHTDQTLHVANDGPRLRICHQYQSSWTLVVHRGPPLGRKRALTRQTSRLVRHTPIFQGSLLHLSVRLRPCLPATRAILTSGSSILERLSLWISGS